MALEKEREENERVSSAVTNGQAKETGKSTYDIIPRFYRKLPNSSDRLGQKIREEARTLFLQKRSKELLDNNELKTLWGLLQKHSTQFNNEQFISYESFLVISHLAGEKFRLVQLKRRFFF